MFNIISNRWKDANPIKKKMMKNVFWAMTGKIVNMLGALFVGILVARYLGPKNYGLMNYVISYVSLFTIIASFGLSNIEVRELSKNPNQKERILGTCFSIRFVFSTIAYIFLALSLVFYETDSITSLMILVYGITLYTTCCFELIRNYFTSIVKNEYIVKSEITRTIIGAGIKILLLYLEAPLFVFIIAVVFDTILVASGYSLSYKVLVGSFRDWKFDKTLIPYFVKQSFPLVLSGAAIIIYQKIDQVMIGNMIDKESVGYFATAGKFLDIILFLPTVLTQTVAPVLVKIYNDGNTSLYNEKAYKFVSIVVWLAIVISFIFSLSAYWLVHLTYGDKYLAAVPILQIMVWKTVGTALSSSGGQLIVIEKKQKWAVIRNIMGCIACVLLNYLLIPRYGIIGSAWVTIITVFISGFLANILIRPYRYIFRIEAKALLCGWKELLEINKILSK